MKIDVLKNRGDLLETMILCLLTKHAARTLGDTGTKLPSPKDVRGWQDLSLKDLDVTMKINGVEVRFQDVVERMSKVRDEYINQQAMMIYTSKLADIVEKGYKIQDALTEAAEKALGMEFDDDA